MRFLFFGLGLTSTWANEHAPVFRGLARALSGAGHSVDFVERADLDRAASRDLFEPPYARVHGYADWQAFLPHAAALLTLADVTVIGSRLEDGTAIADYVLAKAPGRTVYYDLDLPATLDALEATGGPAGGRAPWIRADQIRRFDLVCASALGTPLGVLVERYGARRAIGLLPAVEPDAARPDHAPAPLRAALAFAGSYGPDLVPRLEALLFEPARRLGGRRCVVTGSGFADGPSLAPGTVYLPHLGPADRARLFAAAAAVLALPRCGTLAPWPGVPEALFAAAGAGACVLAEPFPGIECLFRPAEEILLVRGPDDVVAALELAPEARAEIGLRARYRALREHTFGHRAAELLRSIAARRRGPLGEREQDLERRRQRRDDERPEGRGERDIAR